jgi:ATP-dependent Clp protease ATP-binding subunit ClpC
MEPRFTEQAEQVLALAGQAALSRNHPQLAPEHLLLGLLEAGDNALRQILHLRGIPPESVLQQIESLAPPRPAAEHQPQPPQSQEYLRVLEDAAEQARRRGAAEVDSKHLLLALLDQPDGVAGQALEGVGVPVEDVRREVAPPVWLAEIVQESRGLDLVEEARQGRLDPVIGRRREIERVVQILGCRSWNNPLLLGEAGVGKTGVVEGVAQMIADRSLPETFTDHRIVKIDLALLVADLAERTQIEQRVRPVLDKIRKAKCVIVFLDPLYLRGGADENENAAVAFELFKPLLARGELQCIASVTLDRTRPEAGRDRSLERLFQTVVVQPPSKAEAVELLRGLRDRYEAHHRVQIKDEALEAAVELSDRYLTDRCLPNKAVNVLDEAGSRTRLKAMTRPPDLKEIDDQIEQLNQEKEAAVAEQDFEKAAHLRDQADRLKKKKEQVNREWREKAKEIDGVVGAREVAEVVGTMTGIPLGRLDPQLAGADAQAHRLLSLETALQQKLVGQHEAIEAVCQVVRRNRVRQWDPRRPLGCFLFAGPPGVGKTLLARSLAEVLFQDAEALIALDMARFADKDDVPRLTGAGGEGELTEAVRRQPYGVVLLERIEAAHADVHNLLTQIMQRGSLTDGVGRLIGFYNTVLILETDTSSEARPSAQAPYGRPRSERLSYEHLEQRIRRALGNRFRPQLLHLLDDVVAFRTLGRDDLEQILRLELDRVAGGLRAQELTLAVGDEVKAFLVERGEDEFGAVALHRTVQTYLENPLSEAILRRTVAAGDTVQVGVAGDRLSFATAKPVEAQPAPGPLSP